MDKKIRDVLLCMQQYLDQEQLLELKIVLSSIFEESETSVLPLDYIDPWKNALDDFLISKTLEGKSQNTIERYRFELLRLLGYINKPVFEIRSIDVANYLRTYKHVRSVSNSTLKCVRAVYSSFFTWLRDRDYIAKNPMLLVEDVKVEKIVKKPFSDEELEKIFRSCSTVRDRALVEFLYSTAVRVSELSRLNRDDIEPPYREAVVYGKGAKERKIYLNARTAMYLGEYLRKRTDSNPALFVGTRRPYNRLSKEGIEGLVHRIGERAGVKNAHPHRFRRTALTNALNRGMPIQEAMMLAGHSKPETTMRYCTLDEESVQYHHKKYLSA